MSNEPTGLEAWSADIAFQKAAFMARLQGFERIGLWHYSERAEYQMKVMARLYRAGLHDDSRVSDDVCFKIEPFCWTYSGRCGIRFQDRAGEWDGVYIASRRTFPDLPVPLLIAEGIPMFLDGE